MTDKPTYEELERRVKELEKEAVKRKETDESLYHSQEKYQNILSSIEEGYYEVDLAGNLTFFNDSLCKIYGYARDELMGMNNRDYMTTETAKKTYEVFNRVYKTGEPTKIFDWEFIKKDGTKVDVEISVSLIRNPKGQVIGFRGIVRDIRERKQVKRALQDSEEKFRMIFENSSDGIIVADPETMKFLYVNPAICKILGYTKEELTQMVVVDIHPKESLEYVISEFKAQAKGEKLLAANIPFLKKNGTIIYMDTNSSIVRMGEKIRIMGIFRDVTERKQAEEVLRKSEKRYRAVVESQTEMICRFLPNGTLSFVNEAYCRYFNKSRKELIGQNFLFLIPEDDRKKVFKNIASVNPNNPVMTHEHRVATPNGEKSWHRWTNRAIFSKDQKNKIG